MKAFVGISPDVIVTFVSFLWTGQVSDKKIIKISGLLEKLEPRDNIMIDRVFDIADILQSRVTLNIPPFKAGRDQLSAEETGETAKIVTLGTHIECSIDRIKNYHIPDGNCPLSITPLMNQVFTVCSYFTNFLPPRVPPKEANTT